MFDRRRSKMIWTLLFKVPQQFVPPHTPKKTHIRTPNLPALQKWAKGNEDQANAQLQAGKEREPEKNRETEQMHCGVSE